MSRGELTCCLRCGRDTRAKSGICGKCGGNPFGDRDEQRGRKNVKSVAGTFSLDVHEDDYDEESGADERRTGK